MNSRHLRLAMVAGVAVMGLLLGGCGDDDDGGKKSGGGVAYPAVPTARPTFAGQSPIINASGGDGSTGNDGGNGGQIELRTLKGRLVRDNRSRPSVDNNALTAAELGGGTVTYAELAALPSAQAQVVLAGSSLNIDLFGRDFSVPSGTTLDLSGAPSGVESVLIRANLPGDVIRIDGNINGSRTGDDAVTLFLVSVLTSGTAICVDGNVNLAGAAGANTLSGGDFQAVALNGAVVVRGAIDTRGNNPSASDGGRGGSVVLASDNGDIVIGQGVLTSTGGQGVVGGQGGDIYCYTRSTLTQVFDWPVRNFGGDATAQGQRGGDLEVIHSGPLDAFCIFDSYSGNVTAGGPPPSATVRFQGLTVQGAIVGSVNGGRGGNGGNGGLIYVHGESVFGLAVEATANGGQGTAQSGGSGGSIEVYADGATMVNVLVNCSANGGQGETNGGTGGFIHVNSYGEMNNVTLTANVNGGAANTQVGGTGGYAAFNLWSGFGESIVNCAATINANGGNGESGGQGGGYGYPWAGGSLSGGVRHDLSVSFNANGGSGNSGGGGNGGSFRLGMSEMTAAKLNIFASVNGGSSPSANGTGAGGYFEITSGDQSSVALTGGPISANGGANTGTGAGGVGGRSFINLGDGSIFTSTNVTWNLNGGQSATARGGDAISGTAFELRCGGNVTLTGGAINCVGGRGSASSGGSGGGVGGNVLMICAIGQLTMGTPIDVSGGQGAANGAGADAGQVDLSNQGSTLNVTANILADGQNGASAGVGGDIYITGDSTTNITISSTLSANGGAGATAGGQGGYIGIGGGLEFTATFTTTAIVRANGGGPSSNAGTIDINLVGGSGSGITEAAGSLLETRNGAGTLVPGNIYRNP